MENNSNFIATILSHMFAVLFISGCELEGAFLPTFKFKYAALGIGNPYKQFS